VAQPQRFRDFGSAQVFDTADMEPIIFKLDGETFICRSALPGAALLDFVSDADSGEGGRASESIVRFFKLAMDDTEHQRFQAFITRSTRVIPIDTLAEIAAWLVEVYSERPTPRPLASPNGTSTTDRTAGERALSEVST